MKITTVPVSINAESSVVRAFLSEPKNIETLVQKEGISDFKSTENTCSFKVKGSILIPLILESTTDSLIKYISGTNAPFKFELNIFVDSHGDTSSAAHIEFNGDVNAFLKIMVEKPLINLFERMKDELTAQF